MLGSSRPQWLDTLGNLARAEDEQRGEPVEQLDASSLAARIGVNREPKAPAPAPTPAIADGTAPWRKALRPS